MLVAALWCCTWGSGREGAMVLAPLCRISVTPSLPTIKVGPSGADSQVGRWSYARSRPLWVSPINSTVRLGASPAAASTPTGVFTQRFEALFPRTGVLGCVVCFAPPPFLPVYLCMNVSSWGLLAAVWPAPFHNPPPCWVRQPPPCRESSLPQLPVSAPPTGMDECFFFTSLVVGLPYSSIFFQFWLFFVFKLLLSFFWLCEEAQCIYLRLHLGWKSWKLIFKKYMEYSSLEKKNTLGFLTWQHVYMYICICVYMYIQMYTYIYETSTVFTFNYMGAGIVHGNRTWVCQWG